MRRIAGCLFSFLLAVGSAGAEDKTPPAKSVSLLYVLTADSGTIEPLEGARGQYALQLKGVSPNVVYFSDRPNRIAGQVSVADFLKSIGFGGKLNPNAAIDVQGGAKEGDLIVVALGQPVYNAASSSLRFFITILDAPRPGLASFSKRMDKAIPRKFGAVALFIDDAACVPLEAFCYPNMPPCCPGLFCTPMGKPGVEWCSDQP